MTERLEVDLSGALRAAQACRTTGTNALNKLAEQLYGATLSAIEAAAGHDDYGQQITKGWKDCRADQFPDFAKSIQLQLIGRGDHMAACAANAMSVDADATHQIRAADLGLTYTAGHWAPLPAPGDGK